MDSDVPPGGRRAPNHPLTPCPLAPTGPPQVRSGPAGRMALGGGASIQPRRCGGSEAARDKDVLEALLFRRGPAVIEGNTPERHPPKSSPSPDTLATTAAC